MSLWMDRAVLFLAGKSLTKQTDWILLGLRTCLGPGPGWPGWLSPAFHAASHRPAGQPRLIFMAVAGFWEREKAHKAPWGLGSELGQCHFHWSFLAKISHKGSPDLRGGETNPAPPRREWGKVKIKGIWENWGFLFAVCFPPWIGFQLFRSTWVRVGIWAWIGVERRGDQHGVFSILQIEHPWELCKVPMEGMRTSGISMVEGEAHVEWSTKLSYGCLVKSSWLLPLSSWFLRARWKL